MKLLEQALELAREGKRAHAKFLLLGIAARTDGADLDIAKHLKVEDLADYLRPLVDEERRYWVEAFGEAQDNNDDALANEAMQNIARLDGEDD